MINRLVQSRCRRSTGIFHVDYGHFFKFQATQHYLAANTVLAGEDPLGAIPIPDTADGVLIPLVAEARIFHGFPDGLCTHGLVRSGHFADLDHAYADDIYFSFMFLLIN